MYLDFGIIVGDGRVDKRQYVLLDFSRRGFLEEQRYPLEE